MNDRRRGLGKGLGALIPTSPQGQRPTDVFFPRVATEESDEHGPLPGAEALVPTTVVRAPARSVSPGATGSGATEGVAAPGAAEESDLAAAPARVDAAPQDGHRDNTLPVSEILSGTTNLGETVLAPVPGAEFAEIPVDSIRPNPRQPRQVFDEDELAELVASIRELGVLQPVVVRPIHRDEVQADSPVRFELVMGERRLRASKAAGRDAVPAIVRTTGDEHMLRDALLENLHRAQLNPLEEAAAYQQLLEDFGCTHDELAQRIGRSRPQISNTIRLLKLPPLVQRRVASGVLSAGHARALLGLADGAAMERLAQRIVAEGLSVRSVEEIVLLGDGTTAPRTPTRRAAPAPELQAIASDLSERLDTRVQVVMGRRKGKITVEFAGEEDLQRILEVLRRADTAEQ